MSELFPDVIRGLSGIGSETERNVLATQLFGRKAAELTPLLAAGGDEIERLMGRASELGLVMGDESIAALVAFKDQTAELRQQLGAVGARIATAFLPSPWRATHSG
jgi:hypothetical protein